VKIMTSDDSRFARSRSGTHQKPGGTRNGNNVLPLSQHPREGNLTGSCGRLLADLLQTVGELEDVGKFSFEYLAMYLRRSPSSKSSGDFYRRFSGSDFFLSG